MKIFFSKMRDILNMDILNIIRRNRKIILLLLPVVVILSCIFLFNAFNAIPARDIYINLRNVGDIDSARCNILINMDYGGKADEDPSYRMNIIEIQSFSSKNAKSLFNKNNRDQRFSMRKKYSYRVLSRLFQDSLNNISSMYSLEYKCYSNIGKIISSKDSVLKNQDGSMSSIRQPYLLKEKAGTCVAGGGHVLFPNVPEGRGLFTFGTSVDNGKQKLCYLWDITQLNLNFKLNCSYKLNCKLAFEFYGPVDFSAMYPTPDKKTVSGIEFTNPDKINIIRTNGLSYHVDFLNNRNLQEVRNLVITAIMSMVIALICNIICNIFELKKKNLK